MNRDQRQDLSVNRVANNGGSGTIMGCTGYGKTNCAIKMINRINKKIPEHKVIVIVPTSPLQKQWQEIVENKNIKNCKVYTIQALTVAGNVVGDDLNAVTVILDEIHLMIDGEYFGQVFEILNYKYLLGLSGTLKEDQIKTLESLCPVVDTIPVEVALKNGWVADFVEYNLYIDLPKVELDAYQEADNSFKRIYPIFNNFLKIIDCISLHDREDNKRGWVIGAKTYGERIVKRLKELIKYQSLDPNIAYIADYFQDKEGEWLEGKRLSLKVQELAQEAHGLSQLRKSLLFESDACIDAAVEVVKFMDMKTVTFGESTYTADIISTKLGDRALAYHSNLETEIRTIRKEKVYKKLAAATTFYQKHLCIYENIVQDGLTISWDVKKKVGKTTLREEALDKLERNIIDRICSAKALDVGMDVSFMQLGVNTPSDASKEKYEQRRGRLIRKEGEKIGYIVNIVPKMTKAVDWIKRAQKGNNKIRHVNSVKDIIFEKYTNAT
jgi:superfamily II DNA or RNA helicase